MPCHRDASGAGEAIESNKRHEESKKVKSTLLQ